MVPYLSHAIRAGRAASLSAAALRLPTIALSLLVAAWFLPVLAAMFRRLPKKKEPESEIEWVRLWRCPLCNNYNRRSFIICTHCDYHMKVGSAKKWVHALFEWSQK